MNRKQRKQERKKPKPMKRKHFDNLCWEIALVLTKQHSQNTNDKAFCSTCGLDYCLDYGGRDAFCRECRYHKSSSCLKQTIHQRICQHCERSKNVNSM